MMLLATARLNAADGSLPGPPSAGRHGAENLLAASYDIGDNSQQAAAPCGGEVALRRYPGRRLPGIFGEAPVFLG